MLSIIIPTFNEADQIATTISTILTAHLTMQTEIIVVDGGSIDDTLSIAKNCGAITVISKRKGRGAQMNTGAAHARGDMLYFLHADSVPPHDFTQHIQRALSDGAKSGCFRLAFDHRHWFLQANSWFTRFDVNAVRFGDQSLFVMKEIFAKSGGFREDLVVMEDQEIIHRLKRLGKFSVMNAVVTTSARKYLDNGIYKMQGIFFIIWLLYYLGYSQKKIVQVYRALIKKHKL